MTAVEIATVVKEVVLTGAALATAIVAVRGIRTWSVELRGKTAFEVARGLMLATYRLRDAVHACRSPFISCGEFPAGYRGQGTATAQEELDAWAHVYKNRWAPVWEALQDYDARALEAEALWGREIRQKTDKLRECIAELSTAIEAFLHDKYNRGEDFRADREFAKEMRAKLAAGLGSSDNRLSRAIQERIDAIEKEVRPHVGAG